MARAHQLASLHLSGSAVRTDFRPDSDVDVLVRHREGVRPSLDSLIGLEHDYGNVDLDILHQVVDERLPRLVSPIDDILGSR